MAKTSSAETGKFECGRNGWSRLLLLIIFKVTYFGRIKHTYRVNFSGFLNAFRARFSFFFFFFVILKRHGIKK